MNIKEMSDKAKWDALKEDMEQAMEEGCERGYNNTPETKEGGMFTAYQYVLDKMNKLDGKGGDQQ